MTSTFTESRTFTITHARYVASKIAADLDLLRVYHGRPSEQHATDLAEEVSQVGRIRFPPQRRDGACAQICGAI